MSVGSIFLEKISLTSLRRSELSICYSLLDIFYFINFSSEGGLLGGLLGGLIPEGLIDGILPEGMEGRVGNIVSKGLGFAQDNAKKI